MQIFCDFDGTISKLDTTDYILNRFAASGWEEIEKEWLDGLIGSAECMRRQIELIQANSQELNFALDEVEIDNDFQHFMDFCEKFSLPVTIISDGVDYFIRRILSRYKLENLPIIANRLVIKDAKSYELKSPNSSPFCETASGVCKCRMVGGFSNFRVYVGDGRSDFCVSDKVDLIFAKDKLAIHCKKNNIEYIPYKSFADVTQHLQKMLPGLPSQPKPIIHASI